jgi:ABC-2 type transport system permease protein
MCEEAAVQPNGSDRYLPVLLYLSRVWAMIEMEVLKMLKDPTEMITRGVQPALWLLVFGQAFSRIRAIPTGNVSYESFLTPGILAQSITFISIFYGIAIIWERDLGLLQKISVTPIHRSAIILGKMLSASVRSIFQASIVLVLSLLLGTPLAWSWGAVIGVLCMVILGGTFFSGLSLAIASLMKTRERMMGIGQLITMPLFFSSSALYPLSVMPGWLRVIATINPMSYLVDGLRNLLIRTAGTHLALDWGVLLLATAVVFLLNTLLYPRILS